MSLNSESGKNYVCLSLFCAILAVFSGGEAFAYSGGTGEEGSPWEIADVNDLLELAGNTGDYSAHFVLTADIDLGSAEPNVFTQALIAPDTSTSSRFQGFYFRGTFDGAGHKIAGLRIEAETVGQDYLGLFGAMVGVVRNLNLEDVSVISTSTSECVGAMAGYNAGSIENCSSSGEVVGAGHSYQVGGLVGCNKGTISGCRTEGSLRGEYGSKHFGGLVGNSSGVISDCYSTVEVDGDSYAGGLVGMVSHVRYQGSGRIERSYAAGDVTGRSYLGGLAGYNWGAISDCYAVGSVSGGSRLGGLVGYVYNYYEPATITNCYAVGAISINASYNGGLVGNSYWTSIISGCFWDMESTSASVSAGGEGKTTAQMRDPNTFLAAGWDFVDESGNGTEDIWRMPPAGYPVLAYQGDVTVPDVGGLALGEAEEVIEAVPLSVGKVTKNYHATVPVGHVIEQSPTAGSEVGSYSPVHLAVSLGASPYPGGDGSEGDPYQISSKEQLEMMADTPELYHLCFALVNDIDLGGSVYRRAIIAGDVDPNTGSFQGTSFGGSFDGGGHTISRLTISGSGSLFIGLFGWIEGSGEVENLHLEDVTIRYVDSHGIAPLAGYNWGEIRNCSATGQISGFECLAGLVGMNFGSVAGCHAVCNVVADDWADDVGGLVAYNEGEISGCFALGDVGGGNKSTSLGGLVGQNYGGIVSNCYSMGDVKAGENCWDLGSFAGLNYTGYHASRTATISSCYSTGKVCGYFEIGAFVGLNDGNISDCFWDIQTNTVDRAIGDFDDGVVTNLVSKTTAEMQDPNTFLAAGWDFVGESGNGTEDNWWSPAGQYPALWFQAEGNVPDVTGLSEAEAAEAVEAASLTPKIKWNYHDTVPEGYVMSQEPAEESLVAAKSIVELTVSLGASPYSGGDGSEADPYQIATAEQLMILGDTPQTYHLSYVLVADINLADPCYVLSSALIAPDLNTSQYNFDGSAFDGVFDGSWHTITGLRIQTLGGDKDYLGLFGQIEPGGMVRNLGVEDVNIKGGGGWDYIGGLAGETFGRIENCYSTGSLFGERGMAGGLVGYSNFNSKINECFSACNIIGNWYLGGLTGQTNEGCETNNCYATGSVEGYGRIGGLVGENWYAVFNNCYSTGAVTASYLGGGLIGASYGYEPNGCFWDVNSSGQTTSRGGTGKTTSEMQDVNTFIDAGWDFNTPIWTMCGVEYLRLWWEFKGPVLGAEPAITFGTSNTIWWDSVAEANGYFAECANDVNFTNVYDSGWIADTNCTFGGLETGQQYCYRVKARRVCGVGSMWSNVETSVQGTLGAAVEAVLDANSLENANMAQSLMNKIEAVEKMLEEGQYQEVMSKAGSGGSGRANNLYQGALNKLENDILAKTDGCAETGQPDKNDWIVTCEGQDEIYPLIVETIEYVMGLME